MRILLLDNYDSFTYNLYHYLDSEGKHSIDVVRNDEIQVEEVAKFDKIVLSPGPGLPKDAGKMMEVIAAYHNSKSFLGVCLGHQALFEFFGGKLKNLDTVVHGQSKTIKVTEPKDRLFSNLPSEFKVGRYHSWVIDRKTLPENIIISSEDIDGEAMSYYHKNFDIHCVQFHPESILSEHGHAMIKNWLDY